MKYIFWTWLICYAATAMPVHQAYLPTYACLHNAPMILRPTQATSTNKIFGAYVEFSVLKWGLQYPSHLCLLTIPTHLLPTHNAYPLMPTHNAYPLMPTCNIYPLMCYAYMLCLHAMPTCYAYYALCSHHTYLSHESGGLGGGGAQPPTSHIMDSSVLHN